ncbi:probable ADP-ribosylation factor GTPase-activating protein AGD14 [Mercurialis annua]|uniref:probable ADP-ribosylation factor GTPase-activating protein AGD14 n=1 Tax=Mercurialis annua TaxID=3986 RepID=UPI00215ED3EA|nr:probable ADP-ribosylation factor GTPase-activating protein AGD14 [Mercurialis annua]XP_050206896.1 probable ADP-ribosylation factor GTPase-activating protein AGD14 [Mercurialis annua]
MANRVREDEKNERIIRGLLKLPENRRCINCNSLGPQYVCTNFWTFVCTPCSGIHREFTHRVKSISMAKFTTQEVTALQEGGNKHAREIYLKEWDPQRQSAPDSSKVDRLRDFIKHVYVDRRYSGDKNYGKPPKLGDKDDSYRGGSRSPPYEDTYERRHSEMSSPGGRSDDRNSRHGYDERRSPGYDQESRQYNDHRRSPARPEVVNDWRREDRFANGRKADDHRASDGESKLESRSPERLKDPESSSPPVVRPVREILGDNIVPLRIGEPPKANIRAADGFSQTQRTASSSSLGSTNSNPPEVKLENAVSLIDFDADPEPPVTSTVPQAQQTTASHSIAQPASATNDNNWASFDFNPDVKVSQTSPHANSLDSVLSQLSVPASTPSHAAGPGAAPAAPVMSAGNAPVFPLDTNASVVNTINSLPTFHPVGVSTVAPGLAPPVPVNGGPWPSVQHQQPFQFPASSGQPTNQQFTPPFNGALGNQPWNLSVASNVPTNLNTQTAGAPHGVSAPAPGSASQPPAIDVKSSGRQELPADLFTATYSSFHAPVHGWQTGPPRGVGFSMQYINAPVPMPMPTSIQPSKSMNPFDLNEPSPAQVQTFPTMASLQGALPNMPTSYGLQHNSGLGGQSSVWTPSHSLPYQSALPPQQPSYVSAIPPRTYMGQQMPSSMALSGPQGTFGTDRAAYGTVNMDQQLAGKFSAPAAPSPFSSIGGNPFG